MYKYVHVTIYNKRKDPKRSVQKFFNYFVKLLTNNDESLVMGSIWCHRAGTFFPLLAITHFRHSRHFCSTEKSYFYEDRNTQRVRRMSVTVRRIPDRVRRISARVQSSSAWVRRSSARVRSSSDRVRRFSARMRSSSNSNAPACYRRPRVPVSALHHRGGPLPNRRVVHDEKDIHLCTYVCLISTK
jgi:hypothetical protein